MYSKIKIIALGAVLFFALSVIIFSSPVQASAFMDQVSAFASAHPSGGTLRLAPGAYTVDADFEIPQNVTLRFEEGAVISVPSGVRLTVIGALDDCRFKIFEDANTDPAKGVKFKNGSISFVRPEWWGAKTDDNPASAADNSNALEKAMHAWWKYDSRWITDSRYESMPKILLSIGKYYIDRTLEAPGGLALEGQGDIREYNNVSVLRLKDGSNCAMIRDHKYSGNAYGGSISNVYFHGGSQSEKVNGIEILYQTHSHRIKNNAFSSFNGFAIYCAGNGGQNMVEGNIVTNSANGIRSGNFDGYMRNNDVSFNGEVGFQLMGYAIVFEGNHVSGGSSGKYCLTGSAPATYQNILESCDYGIYTDPSGSTGHAISGKISRNIIRNNRKDGIYSGRGIWNASLMDNTITGNQGYGINISGANDSKIKNNNLTNNTSGPIYVSPNIGNAWYAVNLLGETPHIENNTGVDTSAPYPGLAPVAAPQVTSSHRWTTNNTTPLTFTDFSGAPRNKEFLIDIADSNTTFKLGSSAPGSEAVTNGNFNSSSNWVFNGNGSWSYDAPSQSAKHTIAPEDLSDDASAMFQSVGSVTKGEYYQVTFTIKNYASGYVYPDLGSGPTGAAAGEFAAHANGAYTQVLRVKNTLSTAKLRFLPTADFFGSIDDVSMKKVDTTLRGFGGVDKKFNSGETVRCLKGPDTYWYCDDAKLPFVANSSADLNSDSKIDLTDFNILKSDFQKLTGNLLNPKSDINADGQATIKDVGILMSGWKP